MKSSSQKGTVTILLALLLPTLMGLMALAIDMGFVLVKRNQMQVAADSAALLAANARQHGEDINIATDLAYMATAANGFHDQVQNVAVTVTIPPGGSQSFASDTHYVRTTLTQPVPAFLAWIFGVTQTTTSATAIAGPSGGGNPCLLTLGTTGSGALSVVGNSVVTASMLHVGPNFDLLAAPEDPATNSTISSLQLERLLQLVETQYEMVVLDVDHVLSPLTIKALNMCDVVFLVMENLLPFVRDAKRLVRQFRALGYDDSKIRIIVNRYEKNGTIDISEIEKAIGLKVSHTIRSSFADVAQAINMGAPITEVNPNNAIVQVLRDIAHGFDSTHPNRGKRWIDRFIGTHN